MRIIALHGPDRSGKDSWFQYASRYGEDPRFKRIAFADSVKARAWNLGWNGEKSAAGRDFLWDVSRQMSPSPTELGKRQILDALDLGFVEAVVITDLRYQIEHKMLCELGLPLQIVETTPAWVSEREMVSRQRAIVRSYAIETLAGGAPRWSYAERTDFEIVQGLL